MADGPLDPNQMVVSNLTEIAKQISGAYSIVGPYIVHELMA